MRHHYLTFILIVAAMTPRLHAQEGMAKDGMTGNCAIWGQLVTPGRSLDEPTDIELLDGNHKRSQKTRAINGNFNFNAVPPGFYQFRVLDRSGRQLYKVPKTLKGNGDYVIIVVPQVRSPRSGINVISFTELRHTIDAKARKEFKVAEKAFYDGQYQISADHLVKALEIDPQYMEARATLVDAYVTMDRIEEALQESRRAFEMNPTFPESAYLYAILLMTTKNYEVCETVVRDMLKNQNYVAELKATLAVSLINQRRDLTEALGLLQQSADEFPVARLLAANAFAEVRQPAEARNQVKEYLTSANKCERKALEAWIIKSTPGVRLGGGQ